MTIVGEVVQAVAARSYVHPDCTELYALPAGKPSAETLRGALKQTKLSIHLPVARLPHGSWYAVRLGDPLPAGAPGGGGWGGDSGDSGGSGGGGSGGGSRGRGRGDGGAAGGDAGLVVCELQPVADSLIDMVSPSQVGKPGKLGILDFPDFVEYIVAPATIAVPDDVRDAAAVLFKAAAGCHTTLLSATDCYKLASHHLPHWVHRVGIAGGSIDAKALWGDAAACTSALEFPMACNPELLVCTTPPAWMAGAGGRLAPGFNGKRKSVDFAMWHQAVTYTLMDMTAVFFPAKDGKPGERVFYDTPPIGYAVVGYPVVAHYLVVEWVGKLLVSVASQPFYLGTDEHAAAAAALPKPTYSDPVRLPDVADWVQASSAQWTVAAGTFYKVVAAGRQAGKQFASMHAVYKHLATLALEVDGTCPRAAQLALTARAAYGAHEVLVTMEAFAGEPCGDSDVLTPGPIQSAVAAAVAWLASHRVVYVDVRGPNVLKSTDDPSHVRLVDFDDARVTPMPVTTYDGYMTALRDAEEYNGASHGASAFWGNTFAARVLELGNESMDAIRDALKAAFAEGAAAPAAAKAMCA